MASIIKLTERSDGTIYLQCRSGEIGQPCGYCGEITYTPDASISVLRQAKLEAYEHCWKDHKIGAWAVTFDVAYYQPPSYLERSTKPFLVTTEPKKEASAPELQAKKVGA